MHRKKTVFLIFTAITTMVFFFSCIGVDGSKIPEAGTEASQPGSGPDTLIAIFTGNGVTGSVDLTLSSMAYIRGGQGGSVGDTLVLTMTKRVCQPGSSGDTCYTLIETRLK